MTAHLAIHLSAQNSALLIYQEDENFVAIESFEASLPCDTVMHAQGRLKRLFPESAVAIPRSSLSEENFRAELIHQLHKLNNEHVLPTIKAKFEAETPKYDCESPFLIRKGFMQVLLSMGEPRNTNLLQKCTRDDVLCDGEGVPWRRSSFWLVLKVSIQRALQHAFPSDDSHSYYKSFLLFSLSLLGQIAVEQSMPSDLLHIIGSKIAKRATKAQGKVLHSALETALDTVKGIRHHLQTTWADHQRDCSKSLPHLNDLSFSQSDIKLKLGSTCTVYLKKALEGELDRYDQGIRTGKSELSDQNKAHHSPDSLVSFFNKNDTSPPLLQLADFEDYVRKDLPAWPEIEHSTEDCVNLLKNMKQYWTLATQEYEACPREISNAILVISEAWMAIDKYCLRHLELLRSYSPEIPQHFLQPLLLPERDQLQRLNLIETHLEMRHSSASKGNVKVLADPESTSFSVRYYEKDPNLRSTKTRIEDPKRKERQEKYKIWEDKRQEIEDLLKTQEDEVHTHEEDFSAIYAYAKECEKCHNKQKAEKMRIEVLRRPLPSDEAQMKSTVFELHSPVLFSFWRDATWMLLQDVGRRNEPRKSRIKIHLHKSGYLKSFNMRKDYQRITFASEIHVPKSKMLVPEDFNDMVWDNPLAFRLYDNELECWVSDQPTAVSVKALCTIQLPEGPLRDLQWAVSSTNHKPKQCIAKRYRMSPDFTLGDFDSFAHLRAGERMQWLNILKNLAFENLSLNSESVVALLCQAAWEAGSTDASMNCLREAHSLFSDAQFCAELLATVRRRIDPIRGNWKEYHSMWILIVIILRLLSLAPSSKIEDDAVRALLEVRSITRDWYLKLRALDNKAEPGKRSEEFEQLSLRAALLCCSTFNVELRHRTKVLSINDHFQTFAECKILIHMHKPNDYSMPLEIRTQLLLSFKLAYALRFDLVDLVSRHGLGLNDGLQISLGDIRMCSDWNLIGRNGKGWFVENQTIENQGLQPRIVRFDLFSGELSVNGLQHGSIPVQYRTQSLFERIFGHVN